jgi:hypothetical protein
VTGNQFGMETLDHTNTRDPHVPLGWSSEREHLVDLIVSDVACNDGIERRNVKNGTRRDITLADFNHAQLVPFKVYDFMIEGDRGEVA